MSQVVLPPSLSRVGASAVDVPEAVDAHLGPWERHVATATWLFVGLGIALRLARYLLCFPLWGDETMAAANFLDRGYADLLKPLDYGQTCPLLFLCAELTIVKLWGFHEMALRLVPTLCGLASVVLFRDFAARVLRGLPLLLAVGVFAVSYYPIRHSAEVKPYAGDLLAALVLLCLAVRWLRQPERMVWLWALAAVAPLCLGLSFTAVFVAGGVSLALLARVWRQSDRATWTAFVTYNAAVAVAFGALYLAFLRPHLTAVSHDTSYHWPNAFPPLTEPAKLPLWLVSAHTGHMLAYPFGGGRGGSSLTALWCLTAIVVLCRRRHPEVLALSLLPLALGFVAAALGKYPYGQTARTMQYIAPAVCLLCGLGMAAAATWFRQAIARRLAVATVLALAVLGVVGLSRDLLQPFKTRCDRDTRDFARWFWTAQDRGAELLCAHTDLGLDIRYIQDGFVSPEYLCQQRIFRRPESVAARLERAQGSERPLRVVVHHGQYEIVDDFAMAWWGRLFSPQRPFELMRVSAYRVNPGQGRVYDHVYHVYEFAPGPAREAAGETATSQPSDSGVSTEDDGGASDCATTVARRNHALHRASSAGADAPLRGE